MSTSTTTRHNVLLVEDDRFLSRVLASKLKREGFEVKVARNGEQALETLVSFIPDIMLLDLIMPQADGFFVLQHIRADQKYKNIPVMVLSNLSQASDVAATEELGVLEHLVKANTPLATIVERIKHHLTTAPA